MRTHRNNNTENPEHKKPTILTTIKPANIKTLLIEGNYSPINCCHRAVAEQAFKKFFERHHNRVDRYNVAVSKRTSDLKPQSKHSNAFKYRIFIFTDISQIHRYVGCIIIGR